jgi:hypothetical protein
MTVKLRDQPPTSSIAEVLAGLIVEQNFPTILGLMKQIGLM